MRSNQQQLRSYLPCIGVGAADQRQELPSHPGKVGLALGARLQLTDKLEEDLIAILSCWPTGSMVVLLQRRLSGSARGRKLVKCMLGT